MISQCCCSTLYTLKVPSDSLALASAAADSCDLMGVAFPSF